MAKAEISASTASRVAAELDEELATFRGRRLDHTGWSNLMLDARYEKARVEGEVMSQAKGEPSTAVQKASQHEPAGEPDETAEEADEGGWRSPEPRVMRSADRGAAAGIARVMADEGEGVLRHGDRSRRRRLTCVSDRAGGEVVAFLNCLPVFPSVAVFAVV